MAAVVGTGIVRGAELRRGENVAEEGAGGPLLASGRLEDGPAFLSAVRLES